MSYIRPEFMSKTVESRAALRSAPMKDKVKHKIIDVPFLPLNLKSEIQNPKSNGLQPMQLSIFPQNIEPNATNRDSPAKMTIIGGIT